MYYNNSSPLISHHQIIMRAILFTTSLLYMFCFTFAARILVVLPFNGKSHYIFFSAIINALLQKGHEVVEYSSFPPAQVKPNFTHEEIHNSYETFKQTWTYEDFLEIMNGQKDIKLIEFRNLRKKMYRICKDALSQEKIKKLLNSEEHFDLVMLEASFAQESMLIFGHKFGVPVINVQGFPTWCSLNSFAGNSLAISSVPDLGSLYVATDQMSFTSRLLNLASVVLNLFVYNYYHLPQHEKLIRDSYEKSSPHLSDMVANISLHLINSHPAIEYTRPYTPNIIPLGGISVSPDRVTLPQDFQNFMDNAEEGVIYFSLGTVVPAHVFPAKILQTFINVFKNLRAKVLWKIDLEEIPGLSKNVKLAKWVPQPGILAHRNCRLFMTHGGLFSQFDAINAGVPTVGIPFFGDQFANVRMSEHRGFGVMVDIETLTEKSLMTALNTVLHNQWYKETAVRLSRLFRDRPMSPADSAVYWVEYVLRHRGARHLRSYAAHMPWYQLALLDVVVVTIAAILATLRVLFWTLTWNLKQHPKNNSKKQK